jgi:hypothetical protein
MRLTEVLRLRPGDTVCCKQDKHGLQSFEGTVAHVTKNGGVLVERLYPPFQGKRECVRYSYVTHVVARAINAADDDPAGDDFPSR